MRNYRKNECKMNVIRGFKGYYSWLSNFYICEVHWHKHTFTSAEHAYQSAKCFYTKDFELIKNAPLPKAAKRLAKTVKVRPGWDSLKLDVMSMVCFDKFNRNLELKKKLLGTSNTKLEEANTWGDRFWGTCEGIGKNYLGLILMDIRNRLSVV